MIPAGAISADSHVTKPPHCYTDFIEPKYRDVAPHIVEEDNGRHVFKIKDLDMTVPLALAGGAGYSIEERARRQDDWVAFRVKELLDPQQLIWANDFPHTDSTWPNSQELLAEHASGLTEAERQAIGCSLDALFRRHQSQESSF